MIPQAYRALFRDRRARRLLPGLGVSALGDGMSTVTIAWLAVRTAPTGELGLFVVLAHRLPRSDRRARGGRTTLAGAPYRPPRLPFASPRLGQGWPGPDACAA